LRVHQAVERSKVLTARQLQALGQVRLHLRHIQGGDFPSARPWRPDARRRNPSVS
jgi:hypothetical protein